MLKACLVLMVGILSSGAFAHNPLDVKELVKQQLWVEGITPVQPTQAMIKKQQSPRPMPEEISRVLAKFRL